jgi:hypothetical protein
LDGGVKKTFPSLAPMRRNYKSRLLKTMQTHKTDLQNLFITITDNGSDRDPETVCFAHGYLALLLDFDFNFSLAVSSAIFPHLDSLFQILHSKSSNIVSTQR